MPQLMGWVRSVIFDTAFGHVWGARLALSGVLVLVKFPMPISAPKCAQSKH